MMLRNVLGVILIDDKKQETTRVIQDDQELYGKTLGVYSNHILFWGISMSTSNADKPEQTVYISKIDGI